MTFVLDDGVRQRWIAALASARRSGPNQVTLALSAGDTELLLAALAKPDRSRRDSALAERDRLLKHAALQYYPAASNIERARQIHTEMLRYFTTAWRREEHLEMCPARHLNTVREAIWLALKLWPAVLSEKSIEAKLSER